MACGSEPDYVGLNRVFVPGDPLQLLHFGYAHPDDRKEKFDRYVSHAGHNLNHVMSILSQPTLQPWRGIIPPDITRGRHE